MKKKIIKYGNTMRLLRLVQRLDRLCDIESY